MKSTTAKSIAHPDIAAILSEFIYPRLFPQNLELVPQLNEVYELELAFYESRILSDEEILRNGACFATVGKPSPGIF